MKLKSNVEIFAPGTDALEINPFQEPIKATGYGSFGSPALDFSEDKIDLKKLLIKDEECTFYGRISGDSLAGLGIYAIGNDYYSPIRNYEITRMVIQLMNPSK